MENVLNSISFNNKGKFSVRDSSCKLIIFPINSFFTAFKIFCTIDIVVGTAKGREEKICKA